jgi:hypothetical protein
LKVPGAVRPDASAEVRIAGTPPAGPEIAIGVEAVIRRF